MFNWVFDQLRCAVGGLAKAGLIAGLLIFAGCANDTEPATSHSEAAAATVDSTTADTPDVESAAVPEQPTAGQAAVSAEILSIYRRACISCHLSGAAGAPKSHDVSAWAGRLSKGMDVLVENTRNGLNAMPPRGLCPDCSDAQYRDLILYMSQAKPE